MNVNEFINLIRSLPNNQAKQLIINLLETYWNSGYNARRIDEKKLSGFATRNNLRLQNEIEVLRDKFIQEGLWGKALEDAIYQNLLNDNL